MSIGKSGGAKKGSEKTKTKQSKETDMLTTEKLNIEQSAVDKILEDVLGSSQGLAEIFSAEQGIGLFNSTTSAEQAGDLVSKVVGEIAKLTAERQVTKKGTEDLEGTSRTDESKREVSSNFGIDFGL